MAIVLRDDAPEDGPRAISNALIDLAVTPQLEEDLAGGASFDLSQPIAVSGWG